MRNDLKNLLAKILMTTFVAVSVFQFGALPALAIGGAATGVTDTLTREKINESASHKIVMTLPAGGITATDLLTITYDSSFGNLATTPDVVCAGGGTATAGVAGKILTITAGGVACTGLMTVGGVTPFTATNPGTAGSYAVNLGGNALVTGSYAIPIVDNDQIGITASVNPSITFNVGAESSTTPCAGTFAGNGGTVALGILSTTAVTSSDATAAIYHICTRVTTNAGSGAAVTVSSANAGLKSGSDTIASATASPLAVGVTGYGMCIGSVGTDIGFDTTTPTGVTPVRVSPFANACTSTVHNIGILTVAPQSVWTLSAASQNAFARLYIKAGISGTVPAHSDYADTLTFVATGTF